MGRPGFAVRASAFLIAAENTRISDIRLECWIKIRRHIAMRREGE